MNHFGFRSEAQDPSFELRANPHGHEDIDSTLRISLQGITPNPDFLRRRETLERFRERYRMFHSEIQKSHGQVPAPHVFPAVPAPVAVILGHDTLPKVHPDLMIYDADKTNGGFRLKLTVSKR